MKSRRYSGEFQFAGKRIVFSFWLVSKHEKDGRPETRRPETEPISPPDTVLFLGAGQVGSISRWVSQAAGPGVVVVDGLPHWEAHHTGKDTADFSRAYVAAAFNIVLKTFDLRAMHLIAESQASPASILLACAAPAKVRSIALIRPLGFTVRAFGESEQERLNKFRRRAFRTSLQLSQSLLHDPRNAAVNLIMLRAMLREPNLASFNKKYSIGVSYDLLEDFRHAAKLQQKKSCDITLLLGEKDKMFPPGEVLSALKAAGIDGVNIEILPRIGHSSLAVRASKGILQQAVVSVRTSRVYTLTQTN